jgi:hypothetical protein
MTVEDVAVTTDIAHQGATGDPGPTPRHRLPGSRGQRVLALVLVTAVVAVVAAVSAWSRWTSRVLDSVSVAWVGQPQCVGARLLRDGHTIEAVKGMSCVVELAVHNGSGRTVHLDRAIEPFLGRDGGAVIMSPGRGARGLRPADTRGVDAALHLDRDLRADETWSFRVGIVWRPDGCTDGGTMFIHQWPDVRVDFLGKHATAHGDRPLTIHRHRQNPGCRMGRE